ncbi:hypothetical protein Ciccas_010270 [Cichlidogyrus casuarinus]|uniref:Uncharacterized protein n=1 Tax=Cichlidogyrus casuarinus TaxID=1844966 RepID=A0ABD2PZ70_9PLAT
MIPVSDIMSDSVLVDYGNNTLFRGIVQSPSGNAWYAATIPHQAPMDEEAYYLHRANGTVSGADFPLVLVPQSSECKSFGISQSKSSSALNNGLVDRSLCEEEGDSLDSGRGCSTGDTAAAQTSNSEVSGANARHLKAMTMALPSGDQTRFGFNRPPLVDIDWAPVLNNGQPKFSSAKNTPKKDSNELKTFSVAGRPKSRGALEGEGKFSISWLDGQVAQSSNFETTGLNARPVTSPNPIYNRIAPQALPASSVQHLDPLEYARLLHNRPMVSFATPHNNQTVNGLSSFKQNQRDSTESANNTNMIDLSSNEDSNQNSFPTSFV